MRHAMLILVLLTFGCATDDDLPDEAEEESAVEPQHDPARSDCPGPGRGGGGSEPPKKKPIPDPKDCSQLLDPVECRDCCNWNVDKVWGERCRRMPNITREDKRARARCWADAESRRGACHADCPIEILTLTGAP